MNWHSRWYLPNPWLFLFYLPFTCLASCYQFFCSFLLIHIYLYIVIFCCIYPLLALYLTASYILVCSSFLLIYICLYIVCFLLSMLPLLYKYCNYYFLLLCIAVYIVVKTLLSILGAFNMFHIVITIFPYSVLLVRIVFFQDCIFSISVV